jgi:hypothetical protein
MRHRPEHHTQDAVTRSPVSLHSSPLNAYPSIGELALKDSILTHISYSLDELTFSKN